MFASKSIIQAGNRHALVRKNIRIGEFRQVDTICQDDPVALQVGKAVLNLQNSFCAGYVRRRSKRCGRLHESPKVGILVFLDTPVRQAKIADLADRGLPERGDGYRSGKAFPGTFKALQKIAFGLSVFNGYAGIHVALLPQAAAST